MPSLLPPNPAPCPLCRAPMYVAPCDDGLVFICPDCRQTFVRDLPPQLRDTPQATNVRVVPETCGLTERERAASDRLLRLALGA